MGSRVAEGQYAKLGAIAGVAGVIVAVIAIFASSGGSASGPSPTTTQTLQAVPTTAPSSSISAVRSGSSSAPASPNAAPLATYIEDLEYTSDSEPYDNRDIAQVNGQTYSHSQAAQFCFGDNDRKWTYVLGRKYTRFKGVVGLSDDSAAAAKIRFDVVADGRTVFSEDLTIGESVPLDVPVANVLRVGLVTTLISHEGGCGAASGEWANIRAEG